MELAAAGEDMKKLREIARTHIAKAAAGDMQAIKELADRLDGKPAQFLEHSGPDSEPILGMEAADPILKIKTAAVIAGQLFRVPRSLS